MTNPDPDSAYLRAGVCKFPVYDAFLFAGARLADFIQY